MLSALSDLGIRIERHAHGARFKGDAVGAAGVGVGGTLDRLTSRPFRRGNVSTPWPASTREHPKPNNDTDRGGRTTTAGVRLEAEHELGSHSNHGTHVIASPFE